MGGRYLPVGLSLQDLLDWIKSAATTEEAHRLNSLKLDDAVKDVIAYGEAAVEPVIEHLISSESYWIQWAAIRTLRDIGDPRAIEPLWVLYHRNEGHKGIQIDALIALSKLHDARVFEVAIALLDHENIHLRSAAISALGHLGDRRAVEIIIPLLDKQDDLGRGSAIWALGALRDERAVAPVLSLIGKTGRYETEILLEALGKIGDPKSISALEAILKAELSLEGQYGHIRAYVIDALAQIDHPDARALLYAAKHHSKQGVRRRARRRLQELAAKNEPAK
jgi:HEAT repeat protein